MLHVSKFLDLDMKLVGRLYIKTGYLSMVVNRVDGYSNRERTPECGLCGELEITCDNHVSKKFQVETPHNVSKKIQVEMPHNLGLLSRIDGFSVSGYLRNLGSSS